MWARLLLVGMLLSFSADLHAAGGGDGGQKSQTPVNSACQLPADKGPCDKLELRWFYNSGSKRCERFFYGGCYGNANNFKDINECDRRCFSPDINKPGKCPISTDYAAYTFYGRHCSSDSSCPSTQRCCATTRGKQCLRPSEENAGYCPLLIRPPSKRDGSLCFANCTNDFECFVSGFHRTKCCPFENRKLCMEAVEEHPGVCPRRHEVQTFAPCNDTCIDDQDCPLTKKCCFTGCSRGCLPPVRSYECQPPPDQESCSKKVQRYYYDQQKKECVSYHVCEDKSNNNFETRELCEKACGKISKEVCKLPSDSGPCLAYSESYYYNWETKTCEIFVYGGCQGNQNRFSTKLECQMVCDGFGFCQLPPDRQKCSDESSTRVFYNSKAGVCEKFVYQGCEGNRNNFATQLECLKACSSRDICQLPSDSGFGDAFRFNFFYNAISGMCESFLYKGSRGNANNFWNKETCVQFCAPEAPQRRCPEVHGVGICISQCQSDDDCAGDSICCPTGCGTVCRSVKDH